MLDGVVAASFQDVVEADEVALDVGIGVGDAVAYAGLGSEVDDNSGLVLGKKAVDASLVGDVFLDEYPVATGGFYLCQTFFLEVYVVIIVHRVDADDLNVFELFEEPHDEVAADKAGGSCHKYGLSFE